MNDSQRFCLPKKTPSWARRLAISIVFVTLAIAAAIWRRESFNEIWGLYKTNYRYLAPLGTFIGAGLVAIAALLQAATARQRHGEQTKADLQRRITESFTKAAEQLGGEKIAVRLGGIYTMERISIESPPDYWTVMETLTAFVRESVPWDASIQDGLFEKSVSPAEPGNVRLATDVAAALAVLARRGEEGRDQEVRNHWRLDLSKSDLRGARLDGANLQGVSFRQSNLANASLIGAQIEDSNFLNACLDNANLLAASGSCSFEGVSANGACMKQARMPEALFMGATLRRADFTDADLRAAWFDSAILEEAQFRNANLIDAVFDEADMREASFASAKLTGASFDRARVEGSFFGSAEGTTVEQFDSAVGDSGTTLPDGTDRPERWPAHEFRIPERFLKEFGPIGTTSQGRQ